MVPPFAPLRWDVSVGPINEKATAMVAFYLSLYFQCSEWRGINWQVSESNSRSGMPFQRDGRSRPELWI
jgi:hypothetical protein